MLRKFESYLNYKFKIGDVCIYNGLKFKMRQKLVKIESVIDYCDGGHYFVSFLDNPYLYGIFSCRGMYLIKTKQTKQVFNDLDLYGEEDWEIEESNNTNFRCGNKHTRFDGIERKYNNKICKISKGKVHQSDQIIPILFDNDNRIYWTLKDNLFPVSKEYAKK